MTRLGAVHMVNYIIMLYRIHETILILISLKHKFSYPEKNSEYDQEIPQSQTADKLMAPRGRATQSLRDTRKTN